MPERTALAIHPAPALESTSVSISDGHPAAHGKEIVGGSGWRFVVKKPRGR